MKFVTLIFDYLVLSIQWFLIILLSLPSLLYPVFTMADKNILEINLHLKNALSWKPKFSVELYSHQQNSSPQWTQWLVNCVRMRDIKTKPLSLITSLSSAGLIPFYVNNYICCVTCILTAKLLAWDGRNIASAKHPKQRANKYCKVKIASICINIQIK